MKFKVRVKPGSKVTEVDPQADGSYVVRVKEPAEDGKANEAVIEALAAYLRIPKSTLNIARGARGKNKLIVII